MEYHTFTYTFCCYCPVKEPLRSGRVSLVTSKPCSVPWRRSQALNPQLETRSLCDRTRELISVATLTGSWEGVNLMYHSKGKSHNLLQILCTGIPLIIVNLLYRNSVMFLSAREQGLEEQIFEVPQRGSKEMQTLWEDLCAAYRFFGLDASDLHFFFGSLPSGT